MERKYFKILVLDGGGSKGVYTLGVLKELEKSLDSPIHECFDLIYGTSTGSIIAAMLALGKSVSEIEAEYFKLIPEIMGKWGKKRKSRILKKHADNLFGASKFDAFKTSIGIVSMNYDLQRPMIFKSNAKQAHGLKNSFAPGFGCSISDAVQASCAAYPIFCKKLIVTENQGEQTVIDGGFVANNPTMFAITDAVKAFEETIGDIRILSIGVGNYIETPIDFKSKIIGKLRITQLVGRVLNASTNTTDILAKLLFPELHIVRINDTFNKPEYGTNMVEKNIKKLKTINALGRESYAAKEKDVIALLNLK